MVEKFYRLFALVLVALLSFASLAEDTAPVLYWMVEDPDVTELDGEPYFVSEILSRPDGLRVNGAQVRVLGEDLAEAVYLKLYENVDGAWTLSDNSIAPVVYIPDTESNPPLPVMAYAGPNDTLVVTTDSKMTLFCFKLKKNPRRGGGVTDHWYYNTSAPQTVDYNATATSEYSDDITVPKGTGFWYVRRTGADFTFTWPAPASTGNE